eukprot:gene13073-13200_t
MNAASCALVECCLGDSKPIGRIVPAWSSQGQVADEEGDSLRAAAADAVGGVSAPLYAADMSQHTLAELAGLPADLVVVLDMLPALVLETLPEVAALLHGALSSDCEDCIEHFKPIKRSRSDQSLPALDQYTSCTGPPATTTAGARHSYRLAAQYGSKQNTTTVLQVSTAPAASNSSSISGLGTLSFTRSQRLPSLPVVLSDIGSSTNSLLSLDSDVTSQFAGGSSSPAAAQAASYMLPAASASGAAGLTAADTALLQASSNKRSSSTAALCSMYNVSSAASLTQLTAAQQDLYRTASETSIGSGSYLIQLQQLVPPLPPYSPPPLFSPGPVSASNLSALLSDQGTIATDPVPASPSTGAASQPGSSGLFKGVSIQQQKRAGFAAIGAPLAQSKQQQQQGVRGSSVGQVNSSSSGNQAPVGRRALPAVSSIDSITSVEAGEHSLGFAFGQHRSLASPGVLRPHRFPRDLPSPTAAHSSTSPSSFAGQQHLALAGGVAARQLSVEAQGAAVDSGDSNAALVRPSSSVVVDLFEPLLADLTAAGFVLSPSSAASRATSLNRSLADSPAVQLQAMGSMLGNEGEQWLLPEVSTGAIGLHHAQGLAMPNVSAPPAAIGDSLPNGLPPVQQPTEASAQRTISQAIAAAAAPPVVAVSSALPAGAGASSIFPSTAARAGGRGSLGSFGFGGSRRRGSLELNMPWRSRLDAVIARVAAEATDQPSTAHTNLGGYIGGSDGLGLAAARSYGLEFDGAVVMETIGGDTDDSELQEVPSPGSAVAPSSAAGAGRQLSVSIGHGPASQAGSGAAYELFVRLKCARQTLEFAKRQAQAFAELDKAELGVWEALELLNGMREYESALVAGTQQGAVAHGASGGPDEPLTPDMPMKEHALQVAELCRLSFPDKPWMALVGLLHGLGKLLAHPRWKSQPQWAVAGESFPVGCRFAPQISHSEFLSANPDRRRRTYSTALGVYQEHCGLRNVYMSWGAPEYLYMLLVLNQTELPEEALFMIRYQRCAAITRPGGAYRQLMSDADRALLPLLAAFQNLITYRRVQLPPEALQGEQLLEYYDRLIETYLGEERLFW